MAAELRWAEDTGDTVNNALLDVALAIAGERPLPEAFTRAEDLPLVGRPISFNENPRGHASILGKRDCRKVLSLNDVERYGQRVLPRGRGAGPDLGAFFWSGLGEAQIRRIGVGESASWPHNCW